MAVTKPTETKADPAPASRAPKVDDPAPTEPETDTEPAAQDRVVSDCVVHGGRGMHVGRAVNGKVCSYHAMRYHADGTPR